VRCDWVTVEPGVSVTAVEGYSCTPTPYFNPHHIFKYLLFIVLLYGYSFCIFKSMYACYIQ